MYKCHHWYQSEFRPRDIYINAGTCYKLYELWLVKISQVDFWLDQKCTPWVYVFWLVVACVLCFLQFFGFVSACECVCVCVCDCVLWHARECVCARVRTYVFVCVVCPRVRCFFMSVCCVCVCVYCWWLFAGRQFIFLFAGRANLFLACWSWQFISFHLISCFPSRPCHFSCLFAGRFNLFLASRRRHLISCLLLLPIYFLVI